MKLFTIGYEGATQAEVIAALRAARVTRVIDVRAVPMSRKPGFSKNVLAGIVLVGALGFVTAGIVATAVGEREFHHAGHEEGHDEGGDHSGEGK